MKKSVFKKFGLIFAAIIGLCGCAAKEEMRETENGFQEPLEMASPDTESSFDIEVDPETFRLSFLVNNQVIPISVGSKKRVAENYMEEGGVISWKYPDEQVSVRLVKEQNHLNVEITSESSQDNTLVWPHISGEQYYLPLGEGKRIPANDSSWIQYLDQQQIGVMEQLSMPFLISSQGEYCALIIMEDPYRTQLNFSAEPELCFSVSHEYPAIDKNKTNRYRICVTEDNPVICGKLYRDYVMEKNDFVTLRGKAEQNPNIEKLYGAPFVYLWGDFVISADNINWKSFSRFVDSPIMGYLGSFAPGIENGSEFEKVLGELRNQDYVSVYQKNIICSYISQVLTLDNFWNGGVFTRSNQQTEELLREGYDQLSVSQKIQLHKHALAVNMPEVFHEADSWMNGDTVELIRDMKEKGIDRAWIGLNSWEQAYKKPELVSRAAEEGYLIASYDSYHSIHKPGDEQWITACFDDLTLYENASVTDKNGEKEKGFQNVGRKLNPVYAMDSVKSRMEKIMANGLPFNSWFIDCDATGEIYDDYTAGHITTQEQDLSARLERMAYICDQYNMVIGSEGGNDFAASVIAFAHGIELKSFAWMDEDMKSNKDSQYYIGKYYNPAGGAAEHFAKRIPVKEQYFSVFVNPKYDIPLFKLVYNDSVVTAAHWDWSAFKIIGATQDRMIREVLYNVSPLYHLDSAEWEEYREDIVNHHEIWSAFSRKAVQEEMTDFTYLEGDGSVQKTVFGNDLFVVANFNDVSYEYDNREIPPHSALIGDGADAVIYTPVLGENHK
ncbi:MAG: molecular chaperone GroEL [Lachnospiraceae bacterium]|nr:molecular chaperone GroEL [Lachnospiraceae bacterium]